MTKQEEIKEEIQRLIGEKLTALMPDRFTMPFSLNGEQLAGRIIQYLHSQGVVIKVDKSPVIQFDLTGHMTPSEVSKIGNAYRKAYTGYVAVEPLIKEIVWTT